MCCPYSLSTNILSRLQGKWEKCHSHQVLVIQYFWYVDCRGVTQFYAYQWKDLFDRELWARSLTLVCCCCCLSYSRFLWPYLSWYTVFKVDMKCHDCSNIYFKIFQAFLGFFQDLKKNFFQTFFNIFSTIFRHFLTLY